MKINKKSNIQRSKRRVNNKLTYHDITITHKLRIFTYKELMVTLFFTYVKIRSLSVMDMS